VKDRLHDLGVAATSPCWAVWDQFQSPGGDGHGGVLITDPPASSSVVQMPLAVHHPQRGRGCGEAGRSSARVHAPQIGSANALSRCLAFTRREQVCESAYGVVASSGTLNSGSIGGLAKKGNLPEVAFDVHRPVLSHYSGTEGGEASMASNSVPCTMCCAAAARRIRAA
jgi:hypothetical protein